MISDIDIYRSARVLVQTHDKDAPIETAMRADAMLDQGDLAGYAVWRRILKAVEELQRMEPAAGGRLHIDLECEEKPCLCARALRPWRDSMSHMPR